MKKLLLVTFIFISLSGFSQDIEFFNRYKNDNYLLPKIDSSMNFEEFKMLSQNLRMMDMVEAAIVPGYVHFKTGEKKIAFSLLGARLLSYTTIAILAFDEDVKISGFNITLLNEKANQEASKYRNIYVSAFLLATSTYLFDWIRGSNSLKNKQEEIRYKYAMKMSLSTYSGFQGNTFKSNQIPSLALTLNF